MLSLPWSHGHEHKKEQEELDRFKFESAGSSILYM